MPTITKQLPVTASFIGEYCWTMCPQLKVRDAGRGEAWRCSLCDRKLRPSYINNQPAYRDSECIEVFGSGDKANAD